MNKNQLTRRLILLSRLGIGEANKSNPFISKSEGFRDYNRAINTATSSNRG